jgi:hypothetical protein
MDGKGERETTSSELEKSLQLGLSYIEVCPYIGYEAKEDVCIFKYRVMKILCLILDHYFS